ncbi:putative methylmalonate-semialdehyde dehydrogenase [acylating], mitochondrial, partial [Trichinella murrelli]
YCQREPHSQTDINNDNNKTAAENINTADCFGFLISDTVASVRIRAEITMLKLSNICKSMSTVKLWFDGKAVESSTTEWIDLTNPATNEVISKVPMTTKSEMERAVESCKKAFKLWSNTSIITRQQKIFNLAQLIRRDKKRIASSITTEQGKTLADAEGDVFRGLRKIFIPYLFVVYGIVVLCRSRRTRIFSNKLTNGRNFAKYCYKYGHVQLPSADWCLCWNCAVQFSGDDTTLDVSHSIGYGKYDATETV